jgi:hypothetical protein
MAKFVGSIGFAVSNETEPGVWVDSITEVKYVGDVTRTTQRWNSAEKVNADLTISDTISIVADGFTLSNVHSMKYVRWRGSTWKINTIQVNRPRLILEIGGLYSGPIAETDTP